MDCSLGPRPKSDHKHLTLWQWDTLRKCNKTLFDDPKLINDLPDEELFDYMGTCVKANINYVTTSLYPVCLLAANRLFKNPNAFLYLRYEDVVGAPPEEHMETNQTLSNITHAVTSLSDLITLLGTHTGLHVDDEVIARAQKSATCNRSHAPMSYAKDDQSEWLKGMLDKGVLEQTPKFQRWFDAMRLNDMVQGKYEHATRRARGASAENVGSSGT